MIGSFLMFVAFCGAVANPVVSFAATRGDTIRASEMGGDASAAIRGSDTGVGEVWTNYRNTTILAIEIDAQGKKWFGTDGGVSTFDGTTWTTYNTDNSGLAFDHVSAIAIDAQGKKWFGTYDGNSETGGGVSTFDGTSWTTYNTVNSGLADDEVGAIAIDAQGKKWFGTYGGVSTFDGTSWTTYTTANSGLAGDEVLAIAIDAQGKKWFGTYVYDAYDEYAAVSTFDGTTWTTYSTVNSGLVGTHVTAIAIDAQGKKWFVTGGGVSTFDGTTWTTYNVANSSLASNYVTAIAIDAQGKKWFGTIGDYDSGGGGGVSTFDGTTWTTYNVANIRLTNNHVRAIAIDAQGKKWFGTYGGVSTFDGTTWTTYNTANSGLADNWVSAIAIDAQGKKWFSTGDVEFGRGVSTFDGTTWTTYNTANSGLAGTDVMAIAIDAQDTKWFGSVGDGVSTFDGTTWTTYNTANSGLANDEVEAIVIDAQGKKWFGTYDRGVCTFDGTTWTTYNMANSGLADDHVTTIAIDAQGKKWFGTWGGISTFDGTTWTTYTTANSGLADDWVVAIAIDVQGKKWFGTGSGVSSFDGTTWTIYNTTNSGLADDEVIAITIDAQGRKWFGTWGGISVLGPAEINTPVAVIDVDPNPVTCPAAVLLDGAGSHQDAPRTIVSYEWDFEYDGVSFAPDATGVSVSHTYGEVGEHTVALRVTDDNVPPLTGLTTSVVSVTVLAPIASAGGPYLLTQGQGLTLNATGSIQPDRSCGDAIAGYAWDLNGDLDHGDASGSTVALSWQEIEDQICGGACVMGNPYPVGVMVVDRIGLTAIATSSLTIWPLDAAVRLTSPNGGEFLGTGEPQAVNWVSGPGVSLVRVYLSPNGRTGWVKLFESTVMDGTEDWTPSAAKYKISKRAYKMKIVGYSGTKTVGSDTSDKPFGIGPLDVTDPDGGEKLLGGDTYTVRWKSYGSATPWKTVVKYTLNGGKTWKTAATLTGDPGSYAWAVPPVAKLAAKCRVKVFFYNAANRLMGADQSQGLFAVLGRVDLTAPEAGDAVYGGTSRAVTWLTNTGMPVASVLLKYTVNGGTTWKTLANVAGNPGVLYWDVPVVTKAKTRCKISITLKNAAGRSIATNRGDGWFSLLPNP